MQYLEYKILLENKNIEINSYLEEHHKTKNVWWNNLKGIQNIYKTHLDVFKENASNWFNHKVNNSSNVLSTTAKTCPAIGNGLLNKVHLVKAPCDIFLSIKDNGDFYYQLPDYEWLKISAHSTAQFYTEKNNIFKDFFNIKFEFPLIIKTNNNPYLFLDPQYHNPNSELKILNGVIEKEYTPQQLIINTLIKNTELQKDIYIKKGDVMCYLWTPNKLKLRKNNHLHIKPLSRFFNRWDA